MKLFLKILFFIFAMLIITVGDVKSSTVVIITQQEISYTFFQKSQPSFVGEIADGINALIYLGRGDYQNAGLSVAAMIPFVGWGATGTKFGIKGVKFGTNVVEQAAVHGNSLKSLRPTWGYKFYDNSGNFLKNGITSQSNPFKRYTKAFTPYIWGNLGIRDTLKKLKHTNYGNDLELVLFQFYVKPTQLELQYLKEIESYRKKEKAIGIPIIVTDENFFNQSEEERNKFLKESILQKMDLLAEVVKKKKLDTNMEQLKIDLMNILN